MNVKHYIYGLGRASGVSSLVKQAHHVVGADPQPSPAPSSAGDYLRNLAARAPGDVDASVPITVGSAAAGAYLYKKHRVLGLIGGASLGRNVPALLNASERGYAIRNLGSTGLGIGGSLYMKKHPVLGFLLGKAIGTAALYVARVGVGND